MVVSGRAGVGDQVRVVRVDHEGESGLSDDEPQVLLRKGASQYIW